MKLNNIRTQLDIQLSTQLYDPLQIQLYNQSRAWNQSRDPLYIQTYILVRAPLDIQLDTQLDILVRAPLDTQLDIQL